MLKYFRLFCVICLALPFLTSCARSKKCGSLEAWIKPSNQLKILSTTAMIDDLVKEIGQEHVLHKVLIQGELDPHSYELVKGDLEKIHAADAIFFNGLGLEHGASLHALLHENKKAIGLGDRLLKESESHLIYLDGQVDPHVWMDVLLFAKFIEPIVEQLSFLDPEHEKEFRHRGELLYTKLMALDEALYKKMHSISKEKRYLITSHDAFFYFTKRYLAEVGEGEEWKDRFAAPEGLAPDGQISPQDIQAMINHAQKYRIRAIFPESNLNQDSVKKIVTVLNKRGVRAFLNKEPLYGDTMGEKGSGAESYLQMMEHNASVIEKALIQEDV